MASQPFGFQGKEHVNNDYLAAVGTLLSGWFASPYVVALVVPVGFYLAGAFGKKLIRDHHGSHFFAMTDWYLAPDAALANIGAGLTESIEQVVKFDPATHSGHVRGSLVFVTLSFFVWLFIMTLHKHYESSGSTGAKAFWLLMVANVLAFGSMFAFLLAFKGVSNV